MEKDKIIIECYACYSNKNGRCTRMDPCYAKQKEYVVAVEVDVDEDEKEEI